MTMPRQERREQRAAREYTPVVVRTEDYPLLDVLIHSFFRARRSWRRLARTWEDHDPSVALRCRQNMLHEERDLREVLLPLRRQLRRGAT